jgi:hypothetical protein
MNGYDIEQLMEKLGESAKAFSRDRACTKAITPQDVLSHASVLGASRLTQTVDVRLFQCYSSRGPSLKVPGKGFEV